MKHDRVTSWKVGSVGRSPPQLVMYLTTENDGVLALKLTHELTSELGRALLSALFVRERWVPLFRKGA